jgi:phosphopantetheinyl transferase
MSNIESGQLIQNYLEGLANQFKFQYYVADMRDIESRFPIGGPELLALLSEAELRHLETLKLHKNKIQWISGRYAVKSALFKLKSADRRIMDLRSIDVLKGSDSAPYLLQYPGIHVSITHSAPYCIGAVAETRIGIDLEAVFDPPDSLIQYFFSENERENIRTQGDSKARSIQAMSYWTRKEAVSKLLGLGMKLDFKGLDTAGGIITGAGIADGWEIRVASWNCDEFCLSVAVDWVGED